MAAIGGLNGMINTIGKQANANNIKGQNMATGAAKTSNKLLSQLKMTNEQKEKVSLASSVVKSVHEMNMAVIQSMG